MNPINRRNFLRAGAIATGGLITTKSHGILLQPQSAPWTEKLSSGKGKIRFGIIGIGMEGSGVLANAVALPGVECVGAADLYDGRHTLAKQITGNPNLPTSRRYHDLLER